MSTKAIFESCGNGTGGAAGFGAGLGGLARRAAARAASAASGAPAGGAVWANAEADNASISAAATNEIFKTLIE